MKAAKLFLKFGIYSTFTALFAISTVQVSTQITAELNRISQVARTNN